jgi:hypothetical protein
MLNRIALMLIQSGLFFSIEHISFDINRACSIGVLLSLDSWALSLILQLTALKGRIIHSYYSNWTPSDNNRSCQSMQELKHEGEMICIWPLARLTLPMQTFAWIASIGLFSLKNSPPLTLCVLEVWHCPIVMRPRGVTVSEVWQSHIVTYSVSYI